VTTVPNPFASEKEEEKCATWNKVGVKNILASMLNSQSKKYANNNLTPTNKEGQGNYEETPAEIKMEAAGGYALTKASRVMITSFKYSTTCKHQSPYKRINHTMLNRQILHHPNPKFEDSICPIS
jgi:hypothetical protein